MRRLVAITVSLIALLWAVTGSARDNIVPFNGDDPRMAAAITEARTHLERFLVAATDANGESAPGAALKVRFPVRSNGVETEIIWVSPFLRQADGSMGGQLANAPTYIKNRSIGDLVTFNREQIVDWGLPAMGGQHGHFTTRLVIEQLPKDQAEAVRAVLNPNPVPAGW